MSKLTVATALQEVELIDLKIKESKRQSAIVADKFKTDNAESPDLRKCVEWNVIQANVKKLVETRRSIIISTELSAK